MNFYKKSRGIWFGPRTLLLIITISSHGSVYCKRGVLGKGAAAKYLKKSIMSGGRLAVIVVNGGFSGTYR
jgi:hypothetical protein